MDLAKSLNKTVRFYVNFEYNRHVKKYTPKQLGNWTKFELASMGPSFIKIGQFISTRSDVFGKEMTDELKDLQDNIAPLRWDEIKHSIPTSQFTYIDEKPIASASIGQVHYAKIDDQELIIKVKRPNINTQIKSDFDGLLYFLKFIKNFSNDRIINEFEILFTEYYRVLLEEIDFERESQNIAKFANMFKDTKIIEIPEVFPALSGKDYITMQYIPSTKIDDIPALKASKFNLERISIKLLECYVDQIIKHGSVHVDPHPGNVGITQKGKLVFYDYGMVLDIDTNIQQHFDELLLALYDKDIDKITDLAVKIGLVVIEPKNLSHFKKFLIHFLSYIEKMDISDFKVSYLDNMKKTDMPFVISSKFLLLMRGISILEGNCKLLDPDFNYKKTLDPYIDKYLIDIKYLENKAFSDIKSIRDMPSKLKISEVELEIMQMSMKEESQKRDKQIQLKAGLAALSAFFLIHDQQALFYPLLFYMLLL